MATDRFQTFEEFWPFYVREHGHRLNRRIHFIGTTLALLCLVFGLAKMQPVLLGLVPIFGYGFAWFGHFVVQKNRPATFTYPLWSLRGDARMFLLMTQGRMEAEVKSAFANCTQSSSLRD